MKEIVDFDLLPQKIQESLTDPLFEMAINIFLDTRSISEPAIRTFVKEKIIDVAFGSISIKECIIELSTVLGIEITSTKNDVLGLIVKIFDEETLDTIFSYEVNREEQAPAIVVTEKKEQAQKTLDRDPERVQSSLLNVLQKFNLHIDEQGIIAHEVERYLKGEILSKDLGPHMSALLDKPLSEINEIITALNQEIFKPIQKQIAEDGVLDISNTDTDLDEYIIKPKKGFSQITNVENKLQTPKIQTASFSFIPEGLRVQKKPEVQEKIVSDLQTYGGTPLGTSLQSQEILDEQIEKKLGIVAKKPSKTYTIDPYREIPE